MSPEVLSLMSPWQQKKFTKGKGVLEAERDYEWEKIPHSLYCSERQGL